MRILPISNTSNSFGATLAPTKELAEYKKSLKVVGEPWTKAFDCAYDKFTKNGNNTVYSFVHEIKTAFEKGYNWFTLNAVIRDDKGKAVASALMDRQLSKNFLKPDVHTEIKLFEDFMNVEHVKSVLDSPVWGFCKNTVRTVRPYTVSDFEKATFFPDL